MQAYDHWKSQIRPVEQVKAELEQVSEARKCRQLTHYTMAAPAAVDAPQWAQTSRNELDTLQARETLLREEQSWAKRLQTDEINVVFPKHSLMNQKQMLI